MKTSLILLGILAVAVCGVLVFHQRQPRDETVSGKAATHAPTPREEGPVAAPVPIPAATPAAPVLVVAPPPAPVATGFAVPSRELESGGITFVPGRRYRVAGRRGDDLVVRAVGPAGTPRTVLVPSAAFTFFPSASDTPAAVDTEPVVPDEEPASASPDIQEEEAAPDVALYEKILILQRAATDAIREIEDTVQDETERETRLNALAEETEAAIERLINEAANK